MATRIAGPGVASSPRLRYGFPVASASYLDSTLVLLGHGSTKNENSDKPIFQHALELRRRNCFADVREAFWKQPPYVRDVFGGLTTPRAFVVPFFISEGYFSDEVIPAALGFPAPDPGSSVRILERDGRRFLYTRPVGAHPSMLCVLLARAQEVVRLFPFPRLPRPEEISLFIAGHGTGRNENSRKAIERQVQEIRSLKQFACVHGIFMEEEPRIGDCYGLAATRFIVVVPFFMSEGLHTQEDIPIMLGEKEALVQKRLAEARPTWRNPTEKRDKLVWYAASVGNEAHLPDVILELVREAVG